MKEGEGRSESEKVMHGWKCSDAIAGEITS